MHKVSIIIPTYNRAKLLPVAVASVLEQSYRPLELVVVDDGSTDNTRQALAALEPEIRAAGVEPVFVHRENGGLSRARGSGVEVCTGQWFGFLDDDDTFAPTKTKLQVEQLLETGADCCCCYLTKVTPDGEERHPNAKKRLISGHEPAAYIRGQAYAHLNSMLISRELWAQVGPFDPELKISQDVEWCGRLVHVATFCAVEEELGRYEHNPGAVSRVSSIDGLLRRDSFQEKVLLRFRERNADKPGWDENAWRERVAIDFDQFVKHLLYAGRLTEARQKWREGMDLTNKHPKLVRARRKLRKAWWLNLVGKRVKHPNFPNLDDLRM